MATDCFTRVNALLKYISPLLYRFWFSDISCFIWVPSTHGTHVSYVPVLWLVMYACTSKDIRTIQYHNYIDDTKFIDPSKFLQTSEVMYALFNSVER